MRQLIHLSTLATPFAILALMEVLFRNPVGLPWVVTMIGILASSVTLFLVRPGLAHFMARPLTGLGLMFGGTLLIVSTPLLGFQQVVTATESGLKTAVAQIPWLVTAAVVVLAGGLLVFTARRLTQLPQVFTPLYLVAGEVLFLMVLEGHWFRRIVAVLFALLLVVALEDLYLAFHEPERHHAYAPVNIATYMGLVAYFLFAASLFWMMLFFNLPLWLGALILAGLSALLTYQALLSIGRLSLRGWPYVLVMPLVSVELFWVVSFLPTSVYVGAFVLTAAHYAALGTCRNYLLGSLNRRIIIRYLVTGIGLLAIVLMTAKWR